MRQGGENGLRGDERSAVVSLLVAEDQRRSVCSSSCSLTCATCEAGLQRTTPRQLLSLINFKQTASRHCSAALNSRMNAHFQPSVNKGRKALAGATHEQRGGDKKQNPYENNNAVTCKQGKNIRLPPSLPAPHSLGKRATKEMRSAKFLIKGGEQRDGEGGEGGWRWQKRAAKTF